MRRVLTGYWKRFAGSGIGFAHKYRRDPFFRTELNVIGLQILFTLIILFIVGEGVTMLYQKVSTELVSGLISILQNHATTSGDAIADNLDALKSQNLVVMGAVIAAATAIFAYLITWLALAPARNALNAQLSTRAPAAR